MKPRGFRALWLLLRTSSTSRPALCRHSQGRRPRGPRKNVHLPPLYNLAQMSGVGREDSLVRPFWVWTSCLDPLVAAGRRPVTTGDDAWTRQWIEPLTLLVSRPEKTPAHNGQPQWQPAIVKRSCHWCGNLGVSLLFLCTQNAVLDDEASNPEEGGKERSVEALGPKGRKWRGVLASEAASSCCERVAVLRHMWQWTRLPPTSILGVRLFAACRGSHRWSRHCAAVSSTDCCNWLAAKLGCMTLSRPSPSRTHTTQRSRMSMSTPVVPSLAPTHHASR